MANFMLCMKVKVKLLSRARLFATPWTVVYQASPSMGFSSQEYWSGLPFPSPGNLSDPGIKLWSPALKVDSLPTEAPGKPYKELVIQPCLTLCDPMDCSPPGSSVHGILQARILERGAMPSPRGSSQPRDETQFLMLLALAGGFFTTGTTWEVH